VFFAVFLIDVLLDPDVLVIDAALFDEQLDLGAELLLRDEWLSAHQFEGVRKPLVVFDREDRDAALDAEDFIDLFAIRFRHEGIEFCNGTDFAVPDDIIVVFITFVVG
jgi:hypothetical protein